MENPISAGDLAEEQLQLHWVINEVKEFEEALYADGKHKESALLRDVIWWLNSLMAHKYP